MLKQILDAKENLQKYLFIRGFLISDTDIENMNEFPFYNNWKKEKHGEYWYMAHNLTGMHIYEDENGKVFFLMGHAYNPFTMEHEEIKILKHIAESYGSEEYISRLNELTGIYVTGVADGKNIEFHIRSAATSALLRLLLTLALALLRRSARSSPSMSFPVLTLMWRRFCPRVCNLRRRLIL